MQNAPKFSLKMLREGRSFLLFRSWPPEGSSAAFIHQLDLFRGDKRGNRRQPNLFERTSVSLGGLASWRRRSAGAHLAVELGLLLQAKVLGGVGHDGEGGFWIVPEWKEESRGSAW